jgi:hypothetical protein
LPACNDTGTIGLLAIDPANGRRMRASGSAAVHDTTIFMTTSEVYSNCPQYIHPRTIEPQPAEAAEKLTGNALTADQRAWRANEQADCSAGGSCHRGDWNLRAVWVHEQSHVDGQSRVQLGGSDRATPRSRRGRRSHEVTAALRDRCGRPSVTQ